MERLVGGEDGSRNSLADRPFKRIGDITVFHVDLAPHEGREAESLGWLDGPERSRWEGFGSLAARRRFVLCRSALRAVLCRHIGCANESLAFEVARHGKPFALVYGRSAPVSFNVSHSGSHGLLVVAPKGRLGADVEERVPRRSLESLIEGVLSPSERTELESLDEPQKLHAIYRFWTIKEALLKAHGTGLSMRASALELPEDMRRGAVSALFRTPQIPGFTWRLEDVGTEDFAAAVAFEADPVTWELR